MTFRIPRGSAPGRQPRNVLRTLSRAASPHAWSTDSVVISRVAQLRTGNEKCLRLQQRWIQVTPESHDVKTLTVFYGQLPRWVAMCDSSSMLLFARSSCPLILMGSLFLFAALLDQPAARGTSSGQLDRTRAPEPRPTVASALLTTSSQPARGCAANQVLIPGGTFRMGDPNFENARLHKVALSSFCMDKTEVTVAAFRRCVQAGGCSSPRTTVALAPISHYSGFKPEEQTKWNQFCTWGKHALDQHPINCVDWNEATAYCQWSGGRLPTEAEWEYAARGIDGRNYPWGNEPPDATKLNACGSECAAMKRERLGEGGHTMYNGDDGWPATAPVGSYPRGASPFGVLDMVGNVWEWTADSFADYDSGPSSNPQRSARGTADRVYRGGSWCSFVPLWMRSAYRNFNAPSLRTHNLGFRCAGDARTTDTGIDT